MAEMRQLGNSDLRVSTVGLGTNNFGRRLDQTRTTAVVHAALDSGINFLDTANVYGGSDSETFLGVALKGRRDEAIIATKFGLPMPGEDEEMSRGRPGYVRASIDASLGRLATDRVDLYQLHRPDPTTPIEETLGILHELSQEGKIRFYGCSNFSGAQLLEAYEKARAAGHHGFVTVQNEYSWLKRDLELDVAPRAEHLGIGVIPYFPLASGLLTGKYRRGQEYPVGSRLAGRRDHPDFNERNFDIIEGLEAFASRAGTTLLAVAIGGLAAQPAVTSVIAGATSPEQVRANVAAGSWTPSLEQLEEIRRIAS
ncbi:MAG: aldo/keto reductase [Candidatus Dormibacteria bacterium]